MASIHDVLYGGSVVELLTDYYGEHGVIDYITPDGEIFALDAIVGSAHGIDERDTLGDTSVEWRKVQIKTTDLTRRDVHEVQAWAKVVYQNKTYAVSLTESHFGKHFVVLKVEHHKQQRHMQFRKE